MHLAFQVHIAGVGLLASACEEAGTDVRCCAKDTGEDPAQVGRKPRETLKSVREYDVDGEIGRGLRAGATWGGDPVRRSLSVGFGDMSLFSLSSFVLMVSFFEIGCLSAVPSSQ